MPMLATLNLPKAPTWATDSGRVLDPDDTSGTGEILKEHGWDIDQRPPARVMNWLHNNHYQQIQRLRQQQLMNWWENTAVAVGDTSGIIFHPEIGYWLYTQDTGNLPYSSIDGHTWTARTALASNARERLIGIASSYYLVGISTDAIQYSADAGATAWTTVTSGTIGGSGNLRAMHTKYPDTDHLIVSRAGGVVRIASSGITGAFVGASTPPPSTPASDTDHALIYTGGTTWLLGMSGTAGASEMYKSTDDGDTWAATSPGISSLFAVGSVGFKHAAYSRDTGRLVLVGSAGVSNSDFIAYSDDLGDTWVDVTSAIDNKGLSSVSYPTYVYYCGGNCWVACASNLISDNPRAVYVSTDNAATWSVADLHGQAASGRGLYIACDERKLLIGGDSGINVYCLAT